MKIYVDNGIYKKQKFGGITKVVDNLRLAIEVSKRLENAERRAAQWTIDSYESMFLHFRKRTVMICHDMIPELYGKGLLNTLRKIRRLCIFVFCDRVIFISERTKNDALKIYPRILAKKPSKVIYNPVQVQIPIGCRLISDNYLLYIGTRGTHKNFIKALEYAAETHELLIICGPKLNTQELVMLNGYGVRYRALTNVSDTEVLLLIKYAHRLLYPSLYEGFGLPPFESLILSTPPLIMRNPVNEELFNFDINIKEFIELGIGMVKPEIWRAISFQGYIFNLELFFNE